MKRFLHFVNEIPLGWFVAALVATIVGFGWGFAACGARGLLVFTADPSARPGLLDGIYFSIVTISSLGYGDIHPLGFARVLVGAEVLIGLGFMGLLVAKISSVKQDYILRRMYADVVDSKLEKLVHELDEQRALFRTTSQLLMDGEIEPEFTTTFQRKTPGHTFFSAYRQLLSDVAGLITYEDSNGALFGEVDDSRIEAVYDSIRGVLRRTTLLWERDADKARTLIFAGNGADLAAICATASQLAILGKRRTRNTDVAMLCAAVGELATRINGEVVPAA